jgi:hypothetical protein
MDGSDAYAIVDVAELLSLGDISSHAVLTTCV